MGDDFLNPAIMDFLAAEPQISVDLRLEDRFVDLVEEGFDAAIRVAELTDSSLIARKLAPFRGVVCASPEAVARFGRPQHPQDLANLPCIIDNNYRFRNNWQFQVEGNRINVPVKGRVEVNSAEAARAAAVAGLGFLAHPLHLRASGSGEGRLEPMLEGSTRKGRRSMSSTRTGGTFRARCAPLSISSASGSPSDGGRARSADPAPAFGS